MAVISVPNRSSVSVYLNAGTNTSGSMISKSISMGVTPNADPEKIINVTDLLANVLLYPVYRVTKTVVNDLEKNS